MLVVRLHWLRAAKYHFGSIHTNNATWGIRSYRRDKDKERRTSSTMQPNGEETVQLRTPLIRGNRKKGFRDFKNIRTQARVLVPAALDQCPQIVRERRVYRPGRTVAPQHCLHDRPIRLLATKRNFASENLCLRGNS